MKKAVHGTHEWAASTVNCVVGCSHNCRYCWAKSYAIRDGKKSPENWTKETVEVKNVVKKYGKRNGTVMFPASHDITPNTLHMCCSTLERLLVMGNRVLVVSKPHIDCISTICHKFPVSTYGSQILFRFTIGSANESVLSFWEPNAPSYMERIGSLMLAHKLGFETSVSCEPMLDDRIHRVIRDTSPYVTDAIWLGKANDLLNRLALNGETDETVITMAHALIDTQSDSEMKKLYDIYKDNPKIKWKESIKKVVGLEVPIKRGLDI